MTTYKATGTQLFISTDPLPESPTADDYKNINWVEVGEITKPIIDVAIKTDKFVTRGNVVPYYEMPEGSYLSLSFPVIKRSGKFSYTTGKIKKKKRDRFGRSIAFNQANLLR